MQGEAGREGVGPCRSAIEVPAPAAATIPLPTFGATNPRRIERRGQQVVDARANSGGGDGGRAGWQKRKR
jgi:hypothetical protein